MIIALVYSLIVTNELYKQIDDISKQLNSMTSNIESQESIESDVDVTSEVESETESSEVSSEVESTVTSIDIPVSNTTPVTPPATNSTPTTITPPANNNTTTVTLGTTTDLDLLACVIYQEAGGNRSCDDCRRRVADVVLNRVADPRFPNTIREVLSARNQYGKFYYTGIVWPSRAKNPGEQAAVARAYRIAEEVLNGQHSDLYGNGYVWQAGFRQGTSQVHCCGTYFGK